MSIPSLHKRGQATLEYVFLISVLVAGLLAMGLYVRRAYQGKLREASDSLADQYDPAKMNSSVTTTLDRYVTSTSTTVYREIEINGETSGGFVTETVENFNDKSKTTGYETVQK